MTIRLDEYASYDALGLKTILDAREVTAHELHDAAVLGIAKLNPALNFLTASAGEAVQHTLDIGSKQAAFLGIPFLVKEGAGMMGQPLVPGCRFADRLLCDTDSELVRRLKHMGLIILGSTNVPELASSDTTEPVANGAACNPWNPQYSTGGSSGGASAAVAAGVVPMAQSADGAGSIRTPAHCCGVFGLVPSADRTPLAENAYSGPVEFTRQHVTTRTVRDSAAMLDQLAVTTADLKASKTSYLEGMWQVPDKLRIAFSTISPSGFPVQVACRDAVRRAALLCQQLGHIVEEQGPIYDWEHFAHAFDSLWSLSIHKAIGRLEQIIGRCAGPEMLERSSLLASAHAERLQPDDVERARQCLRATVVQFTNFFDDYDIVLTPTCLGPAPRLGQLDGNSNSLTGNKWFSHWFAGFVPFLPIVNVAGNPAMSIPFSETAGGLPVGVHCVARRGDEMSLLRLAAQFEQANPWLQRKPTLSLF